MHLHYHVGRPVTVTTNTNHGRVFNQVLQALKRSLRRSSLKLNISGRWLRRVFKNIGGFAYKIQIGQRLTAADKRVRAKYCAHVLATDYASFLSILWFSDESHIHLNGYITKRATRFRGFERPDIIVEQPLHSDRVTIWCAVSAHGILGPYFIEADDGTPLIMDQELYKEQVITPFLHDLQRFCGARNLPHNQQWFQQDGATCHTTTSNAAQSFWGSPYFAWY
ncbi:transposable element tc3 transposase-like protein [Holotrichia oblita]|uniref:Transposable element tc3 transposase-like protein n=1 Tax=Holotrichia oblita TaxID=644536 RepID=A0ACB9TE63_HOLOL|nr:transposable element tc3 transposase-like protein [Holotrichia oblita]